MSAWLCRRRTQKSQPKINESMPPASVRRPHPHLSSSLPVKKKPSTSPITNNTPNTKPTSATTNEKSNSASPAPILSIVTTSLPPPKPNTITPTVPTLASSNATMPDSPFYLNPNTPVDDLLDRNRQWAFRTAITNPALFPSLATGQSPQILWLGCSDSRVPETTVLDLMPGEVFVHRNIANLLPATDLSSLSVLQYAVEVLQVQHIIVCGHYGCGGVNAALSNKKLGLIDSWLRGVREVRAKHEAELECLELEKRSNRLVELNVVEQVRSVLKNANVQEAIDERGLEVHGWVYNIASGECHVLECPEDPVKSVFTVKSAKAELQ